MKSQTIDDDLSKPLVPWLRPPVYASIQSARSLAAAGATVFAGWETPEQLSKILQDVELLRFTVTCGSDVRLLRGKFGLDLVLRVVIVGREAEFFNWSVRESSANHIRLEKLWGKNIIGWPGRFCTLEVRIFRKRQWLAVEGAMNHQPERGKRGKK